MGGLTKDEKEFARKMLNPPPYSTNDPNAPTPAEQLSYIMSTGRQSTPEAVTVLGTERDKDGNLFTIALSGTRPESVGYNWTTKEYIKSGQVIDGEEIPAKFKEYIALAERYRAENRTHEVEALQAVAPLKKEKESEPNAASGASASAAKKVGAKPFNPNDHSGITGPNSPGVVRSGS